MLWSPRYGRVGCVAMPFFTFGERLAPVVEVVGYLMTGLGFAFHLIYLPFALLFVLVARGYGMLLLLWAVVLEEVSCRRHERLGDLLGAVGEATRAAHGSRQCQPWAPVR